MRGVVSTPWGSVGEPVTVDWAVNGECGDREALTEQRVSEGHVQTCYKWHQAFSEPLRHVKGEKMNAKEERK